MVRTHARVLLLLLLVTLLPAQVVAGPTGPSGASLEGEDDLLMAGTPLNGEDELLAAGASLDGEDGLLKALSPYLNTPDKPPIVLVHGWQGVNFNKPGCERMTLDEADAGWEHLDEDLEALGFPVEFARLQSGSSFTETNCSPLAEVNAPYVAEAIDLARARTGQAKVILIAHSMGGLVSRAYLESDLYRDDVVALYTVGSPHVGVPVDVLAELVELLTLGAITLEEYCVAQPVVCQFSDNEAANPPGFTGIETFNTVHHDRAPGVYYHMLGGDIGFDDRGWLAEVLYQLIPGPNDGIVPRPSAMGVSSADDGSGPPLPRLGPLAGVIDRRAVYAAHINAFCDDPSIPWSCGFHYNYHGKDRYCTDGLSTWLDEEFRSESFYACLEPSLANRLPGHICGTAEELPLQQPAPPERPTRLPLQQSAPPERPTRLPLQQPVPPERPTRLPLQQPAPPERPTGLPLQQPAPPERPTRLPSVSGALPAGGQAAHVVHLPGGPALLAAHGPLQGTGRLQVSLRSPGGLLVDQAYARAHPEQVRFKGDERAGLYVLFNAEPGNWTLLVTAPEGGMPYRTVAFLNPRTDSSGEPFAGSPLPVSGRGDRGDRSVSGRGDRGDRSLPTSGPHTCTIGHTGPYLPGESVGLSFQLQTAGQGSGVEWLDYYFVDAPDGWNMQSQSAPPDVDRGGWGRETAALTCPADSLAYWGIANPFLAPLGGLCELGPSSLPAGGSFNGPWNYYETFAFIPVESFESTFPPAGWAMYMTGGGSDNHGFQQTSARAHSGSWSVFHDDDNPWPWDPIESWLVMPAHTVQAGDTLAFWQNEIYASYYSYHGVWISSGSPDPNAGDFVELQPLDPSAEDTWTDFRVDLSIYSGKTVYLAFVYQGDYSDEWYLDDISIERLRPVPATYTFDLGFTVGADPAYQCPGSPYVGVTSWYSDTHSGLAGVAMGDWVQSTVDVATCGVSQPCPLPTLALSETISLDGQCPGLPAVEVPENVQNVTFCFAMENTGGVTVTEQVLDVPVLGGVLLSETLALGPGQSFAFQRDADLGGEQGQCLSIPGAWTAVTPPGWGQPQGSGADVPFTSTTYLGQSTASAQLCIAAPLQVDFAQGSYAVDEDGGAALITVTLSAVPFRTASVHYATADGTARAGSDYLAASGVLTFAPGVAQQVFSVPLLDDALDEEDETVILTLSDAVNTAVGSSSPATLMLRDDDLAPLVSLSSGLYLAWEGAGTAPMTVTLSAVSALTVTVEWATADGTATAGSDYLAGSGTLTFRPGETQQLLSVTVLSDTLEEGDETVLIGLSGLQNARPGPHPSAVLTIWETVRPAAWRVYLPIVFKE